MLPSGRTALFEEWRACERLGIRPPGVQSTLATCDPFTRFLVIAFNQIRTHEEHQRDSSILGAVGQASL